MDPLSPTFEVQAETGALVVTTPKPAEVATYTAEQIDNNIAGLQALQNQTETNIAFWQNLKSKLIELSPE